MASPRPPSYSSLDSSDHPMPPPPRDAQPAFRQRKSATIISISSGSSLGSSEDETSSHAFASGPRSTSTSPRDSLRSLPSNTPNIPARSPIPPSMRNERKSSDSDFSLAEEGEATPLIGSDDDGSVAGKWYTGPLFVAGVKLAVLFMLFTAVLVGTFYWGVPALDPKDKGVLKLPRSFEDLQNLK